MVNKTLPIGQFETIAVSGVSCPSPAFQTDHKRYPALRKVARSSVKLTTDRAVVISTAEAARAR